jgi:hypothetical protein
MYWILGYPDPLARGPPQRPIFFVKAGAGNNFKPNTEDPREEPPHEENDDQTHIT